MKHYGGLCAGGPNDGKLLSAPTPRVRVPILVKGKPGLSSSCYVWHEEVKMWVWEGTWPLEPQ